MSFGAAPAFGAPAASSAAAPAFGSTSTFGGFGQPAKPVGAAAPTFGAPAAATGFTGFGGAAGTSTAGATPAFSGFGAPAASSAAPTAFSGFGAPAAAKPASLSFGTTTTASSFAGFGAPGALGGGAGLQPAGGLFSQQQRPAFAPAGTGTLGFGQTSFQQPFQQQQQQQQQQQPQQQVEQLYNSVMHCSLFGDERDPILAKWNMLQASWGVGNAFFAHPPVPPLTLTPENPICRFKTVGYSAMPTAKDEDGLMSAIIRQKAADLSAQKDKISAGILQTVLMNKPNVKVSVDEVRPAAVAGGQAEAAEVVFHVQNLDPQTGQTKKVAASEMSAFLSQPIQQQNLAKLGIEQVVPKLPYSEAEIKVFSKVL